MSMMSLDQIAASNRAYYHHTFGYCLNSMQRMGIKNIEVWGGLPHAFMGDMTPWQAGVLKSGLDAHGLHATAFVPDVAGYLFNIASPDADLRKRAVDYYTHSAMLCRELGDPTLLICPGWALLDEGTEEAMTLAVESLRIISTHAQRAGVGLGVMHGEGNIAADRNALLTLLKAADIPNMGISIDLGCIRNADEDVADYFTLPCDILNIRITGEPAPEPIEALAEMCAQTNRLGYDGIYTVDPCCRRYVTGPDSALEHALKIFAVE